MKEFIAGVIVLFFAFSCQQDEITKDKTDYGQTSQIYLQKKDNGISMDMIPESPDTGGQGGSGGTSTTTQNPYQVYPYIWKSHDISLFTYNGEYGLNGVGITLAPPGVYWDYFQHADLNPTWLYLGADVMKDNIHYIVRGYPFGHLSGYSDFFPKDAKVPVLVTSSVGQSYQTWKEEHDVADYLGPGIADWLTPGYSVSGGIVEGIMTVTYLNVSESGELNLSYILKVGNQTFTIYKNNYQVVD